MSNIDICISNISTLLLTLSSDQLFFLAAHCIQIKKNMSIEVGPCLKFAAKQLALRSESDSAAHRYEFLELLNNLNALERSLLAKYFCKLSWNIGSLSVLSALQELRILTSAEFVSSQSDTEQIHLILNDFLEAEYQLIANLFLMSYYDSEKSIKLTALLDECLRRLFIDLVGNANLSSLNYLKTLRETLPAELLNKLSQKHINIAVELHSSNIREAFRHFSNWIDEGVDDIQFTKDLHEKLLVAHEQESLAYLFKLSTMEHFKEWKFYLILLQTIASRCTPESSVFIRKYLKTRLQQVVALPNCSSMLHLLLTARAAHATTLDVAKNIDAYAIWYKQHIGEMKFVLTTAEFQTVIKLLEESVPYELETDYLEVHIAISISPPVYCGKLVQAYKCKCRAHLARIKRRSKA